MTLSGGKRKVNKSLKSWVAFVKRVQKEEKLSYKDAIHRAKVRKDKGEKWMMKGGEEGDVAVVEDVNVTPDSASDTVAVEETMEGGITTGGRKRKTRRRRGSSKKSRKTKRRRSRRH